MIHTEKLAPYFVREETENYMRVLVFRKGVSWDALPRSPTVLRDGCLRYHVVGSMGDDDGSTRLYLAPNISLWFTGQDYLLKKLYPEQAELLKPKGE